MKIPNHIDRLIQRRVELTEELSSIDSVLTRYIIDNHLNADGINSGILTYAEPEVSAGLLRQAILDHNPEDNQ